MNNIIDLKIILQDFHLNPQTEKAQRFFKTAKDQYAANDHFLGISVPTLRKIANKFSHINLADNKILLHSKINEERLLALLILNKQYERGTQESKEDIFNFYCSHLEQVNNWNLVDSSAHLIIGRHLIDKNKKLLIELAQSENMWKRRIAIISTWYFIRHNQTKWTFKIAEILLQDSHDLIQKAVGWMLREAGKKKPNNLKSFLEKNSNIMARTMLRYAIEKLDPEQKKHFMKKPISRLSTKNVNHSF